jgi:hypothetical protein
MDGPDGGLAVPVAIIFTVIILVVGPSPTPPVGEYRESIY